MVANTLPQKKRKSQYAERNARIIDFYFNEHYSIPALARMYRRSEAYIWKIVNNHKKQQKGGGES